MKIGRAAGVEHPDDERHQQKQQHAADAMQDRHHAGQRQPIRDDLCDVDVAELAPLLEGVCHVQPVQ